MLLDYLSLFDTETVAVTSGRRRNPYDMQAPQHQAAHRKFLLSHTATSSRVSESVAGASFVLSAKAAGYSAGRRNDEIILAL